VAFFLIVAGLLWGRFKAMHVFAAVVMALILSGFMGIKHIYATAVNPSILTVMALHFTHRCIEEDIALSQNWGCIGKIVQRINDTYRSSYGRAEWIH
jgi:hypothetical protein